MCCGLVDNIDIYVKVTPDGKRWCNSRGHPVFTFDGEGHGWEMCLPMLVCVSMLGSQMKSSK